MVQFPIFDNPANTAMLIQFPKKEADMLEGKNVLLRPIERGDLDLFRPWLNDPELKRLLAVYRPLTVEDEEVWYERTISSPGEIVFTIVSNLIGEPRQVLGNCGLHGIHPANHDATFGIFLGDKSTWGKGYGTEAAKLIIRFAFEELNLHRINSSAIDYNEASIRMHEKIGFSIDGWRPEKFFKGGKYHNEILFGLLRKNWRQ